ncbi:MAG: hypothetical protein U5O39_19915 [Gammaproteobacteria bacterium]|nr:hypothetical protein [Gammaproteobacteria bacterium]
MVEAVQGTCHAACVRNPRARTAWQLNLVLDAMRQSLAGLILFASLPFGIAAKPTSCEISIDDVNADTIYTIEATFERAKGHKSFEVPGSTHSCQFSMDGPGKGTMISCWDKRDSQTFFKSDRTLLDETAPKNNLTFKHDGKLVVIKSVCEAGI